MKAFLMFLLIVPALFFGGTTISYSQTDSIVKPVALYLELGGNALVYSVNMDYSFPFFDNNLLAFRAGFSFLNNYRDNGMNTSTFPLEFTGLIHLADNESYFEIGPGITFMNLDEIRRDHKEQLRYFSFRAGYRYQKRDGGLVFRAGFMRLYDYYSSNPDRYTKYHTWKTMLGISLGVAI
ncbi:hypothetical protein [Saccharicrinis sp. FJH54]|uniref:hypothetical protein n=1 Tax=Saccharicrinis sp. FJH54 TaxID=3344665 RepID=UPI0035D3E7D3